MVTSQCEMCGKEVVRGGSIPGRTCSRACAATLRRTWKPVSRDWLHQKYVVEGLGTVQIGRLVDRHPKRVYEWLIDFGIPTRGKWQGSVRKAGLHWSKEWLEAEYGKGRSLSDLAADAGVAIATLRARMETFGVEIRGTSEALAVSGKERIRSGREHHMYGRRGESSPNWKGGKTPERQAFYSSREWATACVAVWNRDDATCRRCGIRKERKEQEFCIHHVVSFAVEVLRAEPTNLVLLCVPCHHWVHSRANASRDFLAEYVPSNPPSPTNMRG